MIDVLVEYVLAVYVLIVYVLVEHVLVVYVLVLYVLVIYVPVVYVNFYLQIQISGRAYHMESYRNREGKLRTKEVDTFHARYEVKMEMVLLQLTM